MNEIQKKPTSLTQASKPLTSIIYVCVTNRSTTKPICKMKKMFLNEYVFVGIVCVKIAIEI